MRGICVGRNSPVESIFKMGRLSVDAVSNSSRTNESDSGGQGGLEQFSGFPGQLVSYPPGSNSFREICNTKGAIGGKRGVKSTMERKESLLDKVTEKETELKIVLGELGLSRKKRVESCSSCHRDLARYRRAGVRAEEAIGQLQVKAKANLDEMAEVRDSLSRYLMLKGYSQEEVNAIKADTYVEEEEEEEVLEVVDGQDGVYHQTVLDNQGDDVELPEGGSEKVEGKDFRIKKGLEDLSKATECTEILQCQVDSLAMMAERDQFIARTKKAEAREHSGGSRTEVKAPLVRGDVVSLSGRIRELESDVSQIQGHIWKGNVNLSECQHKLDAALIREKVLEGEVKAKELLVKKKEELLKDLPAREELDAKLGRLRTQIVDSDAMNLAELVKYIAKLEVDVIYHDRADAKIT
ncbi:hypothetical protein GIB67_018469 [Kingdonia uniflora]|uniref:Uncharacterized protein n=1 Tax=Kingdonia uniflora TaxID=39325 RepID=A0A7J7LJQ2_9MAGN|nr:hypothetical protein GIB67_018469 [Kingdonia uniflora]